MGSSEPPKPSAARLDFETHLQLKETAPDVFTAIHTPWLFNITNTMPGPLMMAQAASAAWKTVPDGFMLDSLQTHFMLAPNPAIPLVYKVQRIGNGRRFAVRQVAVEQADRVFVAVTTSFVNNAPWSGRAMTHAVPMQIARHGERSGWKITLDDFEDMRTERGPFMKFERLPLVHQDPKNPATTIAPVVAQIDPPIAAPRGAAAHVLAVVHASDYHVMDCPLSIHGVPHGLWPIGDVTKTALPASMKIMTSLNHSIHFHTQDGFRADELLYVEVTSPWAKDGRAMINSRIFSRQGLLIATVVQEAFYVFKESAKL
ncbi:palmitoyl-CoA hydrolase [Cladophialophora carrionii]|uniref:Palmitoyl-CoA hydrolase n=1 Tax=Cladophialophora carrionii TaxID=86049 RepID=A0A1C1D120_9EURO|nr:palmitoyl-CoA hydrolase [Cladophialophora carrionii]